MRYSKIRIFVSPRGMSRLTPRDKENFKYSGPRRHYDNSAQTERRVYQYERLGRNDITNFEIFRTCTPFDNKAAQIPQNKSEETWLQPKQTK